MSVLLDVQSLSVFDQNTLLVSDLSFQLNHNQAVTILGETGSGKSLLAHAIIGTLPDALRSQGNIILFGKDHEKRSEADIEKLWGRELAVLPQEPWYALNPLMSSKEQVREVHEWVRNDKENASDLTKHAFTEVGLSDDIEKYPHQLSGGMAQRVSYLCATQNSTRILIADEPTKGLDISRRDDIIAQLLHQKETAAVITITHDIEVARRLGGEIIVMKQGLIQERGASEKVLNTPQSDYTKALIQADPRHWNTSQKEHQNEPLISVEGLSVTRGNKVLFSDLSFRLARGEVLGISGDSGSGKSSLADTLLGLVPPSKGIVKRHCELKPGRALKLYQDPPSALAKSVSLQVLIDDLCSRHQISEDEVQSLLTRLNLSNKLLARPATQVSGGELQRFAILRALLMKPALLIADEPTSRLDPITAATTLQLIVELTQEIGCALVLISHEPQVLSKTCHKIITL